MPDIAKLREAVADTERQIAELQARRNQLLGLIAFHEEYIEVHLLTTDAGSGVKTAEILRTLGKDIFVVHGTSVKDNVKLYERVKRHAKT